MSKRRFQVLTFSLSDIEVFHAWQGNEIVFSHSDTSFWGRKIKRNTQLFDALNDIREMPYTLSDDIITDFLYDIVIVSLKETKAVKNILHDQIPAPAVDARDLILKEGFYVTEEDNTKTHYVPLVASASMAREGEYLFAKAKYAGRLMEKITLGIVSRENDFYKLDPALKEKEKNDENRFILPSKLGAYSGLAMSDGVSIREFAKAAQETQRRRRMSDGASIRAFSLGEDPQCMPFALNADNTLLLRDNETFKYGLNRFDYYFALNADNEIRLEKDSHGNRKGALSDGCGFLLPEYMQEIGEAAKREGLCGFQVRMPWMKGLLLSFDFASYFRERCTEAEKVLQGCTETEKVLQEVTITDAFGKKRNLFNSEGQCCFKAIFTTSMFKGFKYFRLLGEKTTEGWAEYWRRLEDYSMGMLIAGMSTPAAEVTSLNYQFLTSLSLTREDMKKMAGKVFSELGMLYQESEPEKRSEIIESGTKTPPIDDDTPNPDDFDEDEDGENDNNSGVEPQNDDGNLNNTDDALKEQQTEIDEVLLPVKNIAESAGKCPELLQTGFYQAQRDDLVQSRLLDLMRGRFPVRGDVRYLIPDPLEMMEFWLAGMEIANPHPEHTKINYNKKLENEYGYCYIPGWTDKMPSKVVIMRNPHYSPFELVVIRRWQDEKKENDANWSYARWCGHLTGCAILPTLAMQVLNGADVDGDRVQIIADKSVVEAAERTGRKLRTLIKAYIDKADTLKAKAQAIGGANAAPQHQETGEANADPQHQETGEANADPQHQETGEANANPQHQETGEANADPQHQETGEANADPQHQETGEANADLQRNILVKLIEETVVKMKGEEKKAEAKEDIMKGEEEKAEAKEDICCPPPIIYGGSGGSTGFMKASELENGNLDDALRHAFITGAGSQIGKLSLDVLSLSLKSYPYVLGIQDADLKDPVCLLRSFFMLFQLAERSLRTAIEIDKAKTGDQEKGSKLDNLTDSMLGIKSKSSKFRKWRKDLKSRKPMLAERRRKVYNNNKKNEVFYKWLEALMGDCSKVSSGNASDNKKGKIQHPLEFLPWDVWTMFNNREGAYGQIYIQMFETKQSSRKLSALLINTEKQYSDTYKIIKYLVEEYIQNLKKRSASEQNRKALYKKHGKLAYELLKMGYDLSESIIWMEKIRTMVNNWTDEKVISGVRERFADNDMLVQWGWADKETRMTLLTEKAAPLTLDEEIKTMLVENLSGYIAFKQILETGRIMIDLKSRKNVHSTMTIPGLKADMYRVIRKNSKNQSKELVRQEFLNTCVRLCRENILSEFMFTALAGKNLNDLLVTTEGEEAEQ